MTNTLTKVRVSPHQIESTNDWKYIGSDTGIGIAIARVMKSGATEMWNVMMMNTVVSQAY